MQSITLYFKQGGSDKVYRAAIEQKDDGHVVTFAYGRRGTTLQTGTKTQQPVTYEHAKKVYDKLVADKMAKGYTPGESGTPYQQTHRAHQSTGILPQLLNSVSAEEAARLVTHAAWCMQEKFDGKRMLIRKTTKGIAGINRKGLIVALPEPVVLAAHDIPGLFILDGEAVGNTVVSFDLLELDGVDYRAMPYRSRLFALMQIVPGHGPHLRSAETAYDTAHKAELLQRLRTDNKEGIVFKRLDALYVPGRPASGGDALKCKFHETASFIVGRINAQRSVSLCLCNNGAGQVPVGNVTIPPNHEVPQLGKIVEVRYLYAFEGGCIYQPVYLGEREDIEASECTLNQLKFKPESAKEAA